MLSEQTTLAAKTYETVRLGSACGMCSTITAAAWVNSYDHR